MDMSVDQKVQPESPTSVLVGNPTSGFPGIGLSSEMRRDYRLIRYWRRMSLPTQFLLCAALIVCGCMAVLGYWVSAQVRSNEIRNLAENDAFYMEAFVEPLLQGLGETGTLPLEVEKQLDKVFSTDPLTHYVESFTIWRRDGTIAYSTSKDLIGKKAQSPELDTAFDGEILVHDHHGRMHKGIAGPLLHAYLPLYRTGTGQIVAVGEFTRHGTYLQSQLRSFANITWSFVSLTAVLMMALLYLVVRKASGIIDAQRADLRRRLLETGKLAEQNARLREDANQARLQAFQINEDLLNQIGSDLHDGPIQLLSLLVLRLNNWHAGPTSQRRDRGEDDRERTLQLATDIIRDLRNLSHGLVLPEIEDLTAEEAVRLAVARHENLTGTRVGVTLCGLPDTVGPGLKVCLYRIVQECLNNAFRHAGGVDQTVAVTAYTDHMEILVRDGGPGMMPDERADGATGLGLCGLTKRLRSFGGTLAVHSDSGRGTIVMAKLPFDGEMKLMCVVNR